jgi:preprotein translocase subunit SecG
MAILATIAIVLQVLSAIGVIVLVLLQHGKGADMGAAFGSGSSGSLFGATGSANFLSRVTAVLAAVFFVCTLLLAFVANDRTGSRGPGSVMDRGAAPGAPAVPAPAGGVPPAPAAVPSATPAEPVAPAAGSPASGSGAAGGVGGIPK